MFFFHTTSHFFKKKIYINNPTPLYTCTPLDLAGMVSAQQLVAALTAARRRHDRTVARIVETETTRSADQVEWAGGRQWGGG